MVQAPEPPRPLTVLYGLGFESDNVGAVCDGGGERCAVIDVGGRVAVIDRATGGVLATEFFVRGSGDLAFDESGAFLGVGTTDWNWRTGEVHEYTPSSRPPCSALSAGRVAWVDGRQFGPVARIQVRSRVSEPSQVSFELASANFKYLRFAGDELLLAVHTDSVDAYELGPTPTKWSVQLEPETGDRWRPYSGNPRVELTRDRVLLRSSAGELRVLSRRLEPIRTVQLHRGESIVPDATGDRFVRVRPLEERRVQIDVEATDTAKVFASTVIESISRVEARFWKHRLILNHGSGALLWDLRSAPNSLWEKGISSRPLVIAGNDQLEAGHRGVQFWALDAAHPPREATSFSEQFLPYDVALAEGRAIVRAGHYLEAWAASGKQQVTQEDRVLAMGPRADLSQLVENEKGQFLEGPSGQLTRVQIPKESWVRGLAVDSKRTRAVVVLKDEWRLYDTTTGKLLRSSLTEGWTMPVATFQPGGRTFLVIEEEYVVSYDRNGRQLARLRYPREPPMGFGSRGGSGDEPTARVVWTSLGVTVSLWSEPEVWFLKVPSLQLIRRVPGGYAYSGLERLTSGVAVLADDGLSLYAEDGALRTKVTLPPRALKAISADGALVAYCEESAVTVVDELGNRVDGDASLCQGATALAVSRSHLAVLHRAKVRLLRRDDRSTWTVRSFAPTRSMRGVGVSGYGPPQPPPPPSHLLIIEQGARFGLSDPAAAPYVTVFGGSPTPTPGLSAELWR